MPSWDVITAEVSHLPSLPVHVVPQFVESILFFLGAPELPGVFLVPTQGAKPSEQVMSEV